MIAMKQKPKIKDCLPITNGIWAHINYEFPDIFDVDPSQLDLLFLSNWSMRTAAPVLRVIHLDENTTMLNDEELTMLAGLVDGMFKHKWDKLMEVAVAEYDPIHNYYDTLSESIEYSEEGGSTKSGSSTNSSTRTDNLSQTEADTRQIEERKNLSEGHTNSSTEVKTQTTPGYTQQVTDGHTQQSTPGYTEQDENHKAYTEQDSNSKHVTEELIAGFNSSNYSEGNKTISDAGKVYTSQGKINNSQGTINTSQGKIDSSIGVVTTTDNGSENITNTGTDTTVHSGNVITTNTGTQGTSGSASNSETASDDKSGERTREYTKSGNIGNISTQKLLNEEIELWKYNFICEIMRDVANFVSLPIYEM